MKIQLASDLHLEFLAEGFPTERLLSPHPEADVLVLAGDIDVGERAIALFADWPVPVLYVMGNHEAYGHDLVDLEQALRAAAVGTSVRFLERDRIDVGAVRFLGCTLWTDYALQNAPGTTVDAAMTAAARFINDHGSIHEGGEPFMPAQALARHREARAWLTAQLAEDHAGPTVVVCHHGVHPSSVHPRYAGDAMSAAFVSDLGPLLPRADVWLHGHVHDSFDYAVGPARVVSNPRGYALNRRDVGRAEELVFENLHFRPQCLVDLGCRSGCPLATPFGVERD